MDNASVLGATLIMVVAVVLIIRESAGALAEGIQSGIYPNLDLGPVFYGVIGGSTIVKLGLWLYCRTIADLTPAMKALSEDHWNDVVMNVAALVFPIIAFYERKVWWIDPAGGLAISAYILWRWYEVGMEQVRNIVGVVAPQEFIAEVKAVAESHHLRMKLLQVVAYHCGQGYIVEVEMLMDEHALLGESNDLAESLQLKIEELDNVERVYVHVSNETRDFYGGKVERGLLDKTIIPKSLVVSRHPPASSSNYMGRVKTASHRRSFGRHVPIMRLDDVEKGDDR